MTWYCKARGSSHLQEVRRIVAGPHFDSESSKITVFWPQRRRIVGDQGLVPLPAIICSECNDEGAKRRQGKTALTRKVVPLLLTRIYDAA